MKRRNRGQILVLFALSLVVLIGMAALGVDVGYMYSVRHDLQRCADSGALAGASRFINNPAAGETGTWADSDVQAAATTRAIDYAKKDKVVQTPLLSDPTDNIIVTFDQGPDRIKVQTERTVPLFFARMFLGATKRITAYAVAEAASVSENTTCMAPWGVPIPWQELGGDPYRYDEGIDQLMPWPISKTDLDAQCQAFDDSGTFTYWSYQTHDNASVRTQRDGWLCPGSLMKMKIGTPAQTQPGWFRPLDLSSYAVDCDSPLNNSAPKLYTYLIKNRNCSDTGCRVVMNMNNPADQLVDVLTGDRVGPTVQAVAPYYYKSPLGEAYPDSIDWDSLMDGRVNPSDTADYGFNNYTDPGEDWVFGGGSNGPRPGVTSRRIVTLPMYDPRVPVGQGGQGQIQPVAFAGFWIQDISPINNGQATITGRLIEVSGPGHGPGGQGGATVKTLRLVE